jgi:hypothetical protein
MLMEPQGLYLVFHSTIDVMNSTSIVNMANFIGQCQKLCSTTSQIYDQMYNMQLMSCR